MWLAAWGGENYELNLHIFKCEKSEQRGSSRKAEARMPLMVPNVHSHAFLGLNGGEAGSLCKPEGGEPNTTEVGERLCLFSQHKILHRTC